MQGDHTAALTATPRATVAMIVCQEQCVRLRCNMYSAASATLDCAPEATARNAWGPSMEAKAFVQKSRHAAQQVRGGLWQKHSTSTVAQAAALSAAVAAGAKGTQGRTMLLLILHRHLKEEAKKKDPSTCSADSARLHKLLMQEPCACGAH